MYFPQWVQARNRSAKKNVLIDSLLTPIVESTYMNISLHSDFATLLDLMRLAVLCYTC